MRTLPKILISIIVSLIMVSAVIFPPITLVVLMAGSLVFLIFFAVIIGMVVYAALDAIPRKK